MKRTLSTLTAAALIVTLAACGGDDDTSSDDTAAAEPAAETDTEAADEPAAEADSDSAGADEEPATEPASSSGDKSATLTLANGETYEFSILCMLESQEAAGSEILFNAVSYDTPGLDITQFGSDGTVTDIATVSVYGESFATLWEASSRYETLGGGVELRVEGSSILGTGSFFPEADIAQEPVAGEIVANC